MTQEGLNVKLSVIVPSYNMRPKIRQCVDSIYSSGADEKQFEVIVCDSSDDGSEEVLKLLLKQRPNMKVVKWKHRIGAGTARNIAFKECAGEYVMCLDADDRLASPDVLKRVLDGLDGKDFYACPFVSRAEGKAMMFKVEDAGQAARIPQACWTKIAKRQMWVPLPQYMPEYVWAHFVLVDRCDTFGSFDFPVVDYDDTPENKGAASRTFDWLLNHPTNLLELMQTETLKKLGLNDEYVSGVIHNMADMWQARSAVRKPEVKAAMQKRLAQEYRNFMSGVYAH